MSYDNASWHFNFEDENSNPEGLVDANAYTHIGFFLKWCLHKGFASTDLIEDERDDIQKVLQGSLTGPKFLEMNCDGKLYEDALSETGNQFARDYYGTKDSSEFGKNFNGYIDDYSEIFVEFKVHEMEIPYRVKVNDENYQIISEKIDERYKQWLAFTPPYRQAAGLCLDCGGKYVGLIKKKCNLCGKGK